MAHRLVVHCKKFKHDIYVGRGNGNILGNPFSHKDGTLAKFRVKTREEAVAKFEEYARERMETDENFKTAVALCYGKVLGCWCAPQLCHGEILVKLAEELHNARAIPQENPFLG